MYFSGSQGEMMAVHRGTVVKHMFNARSTLNANLGCAEDENQLRGKLVDKMHETRLRASVRYLIRL